MSFHLAINRCSFIHQFIEINTTLSYFPFILPYWKCVHFSELAHFKEGNYAWNRQVSLSGYDLQFGLTSLLVFTPNTNINSYSHWPLRNSNLDNAKSKVTMLNTWKMVYFISNKKAQQWYCLATNHPLLLFVDVLIISWSIYWMNISCKLFLTCH